MSPPVVLRLQVKWPSLRGEKKAKKLGVLFQKVIRADGASRAERYLLVVRTLCKGNRVETLMKGMLEDVQLLAINDGMTPVADTQRKELFEAIKAVVASLPSIPGDAVEGTVFTSIHSGSGSINQADLVNDLYVVFEMLQIFEDQPLRLAHGVTTGDRLLWYDSL